MTYFGVGGKLIDADLLGEQLASQGYGDLSGRGLWRGSTNQTFAGRFTFDPEASTLSKESLSSGSYTSTLSGTYSTFNVGYVLVSKGSLWAYPYVGAGYGSFTLQITEDVGPLSFGEILDDSRRGISLKNRGWLLNAGLGTDYVLKLREDEERGISGVALGLRAGYLFVPATDDWKMLDEVEVGGDPRLTPSGLYFRLLVGFGRFVK